MSDSSKRLFAVVYLNGRQWKISQGDLIALEGELPLNVGDVLNLEKVLSQITVLFLYKVSGVDGWQSKFFHFWTTLP